MLQRLNTKFQYLCDLSKRAIAKTTCKVDSATRCLGTHQAPNDKALFLFSSSKRIYFPLYHQCDQIAPTSSIVWFARATFTNWVSGLFPVRLNTASLKAPDVTTQAMQNCPTAGADLTATFPPAFKPRITNSPTNLTDSGSNRLISASKSQKKPMYCVANQSTRISRFR